MTEIHQQILSSSTLNLFFEDCSKILRLLSFMMLFIAFQGGQSQIRNIKCQQKLRYSNVFSFIISKSNVLYNKTDSYLFTNNSRMDIIKFMGLYTFIGTFLLFSSLNSVYFLVILALGFVTFLITSRLIDPIANFMLKNNIFGYDINKKGSPMGQKKIPECVGFSSAVAFVIVGMVACLIIKSWQKYNDLGELYEQIHLSYLVTILGKRWNYVGTILLGFADDMLDLPWRYKLIFPFFIVIPMITNYYGPTSVQFTYPINLLIQRLELGPVFMLYVTLLGIYCTNTINIYAGINGLQVGQSIVAASSLLIIFGIKAFKEQGLKENYYYSIYLLITFLGSAFALFRKNVYPSKIFIGDTFCYFSGIVLCLSAIIGQNGISIHWLLFPQLINFLYSCPQLFGYYPCPRHRLAIYDPVEDKISANVENMNLLNLSLKILGKQNQGNHCKKLLYFQVLTSLVPIVYEIFI